MKLTDNGVVFNFGTVIEKGSGLTILRWKRIESQRTMDTTNIALSGLLWFTRWTVFRRILRQENIHTRQKQGLCLIPNPK